VKIAAIVPIGYLDRHGYQHVYRECVGSIAAFADHVFLVQSVREDTGARALCEEHGNVSLVSGDATWFGRTPEGAEWFDAYRVMENVNLGAGIARAEGYDVGICLMVNHYVPEGARAALRQACLEMVAFEAAWTWYYRRDQLASMTFGASVRLPFIVNLELEREWRFSADALAVRDEVYRMERGDWPIRDAGAVVDVQLEMTLDDLRGKTEFTRGYHDLLPKRPRGWDWDYWRRYYVEKFRAKRRTGLASDPTGVRIAAASRPDFVSHTVLGAL
jgi:hypothetical protein